MFKLYRKLTRPSQSIAFGLPETDEQKQHTLVNYIETKKFISRENPVLSKDGLILEQIITWRSLDDFIDFRLDDFYTDHNQKVVLYQQENNIIRVKILINL